MQNSEFLSRSLVDEVLDEYEKIRTGRRQKMKPQKLGVENITTPQDGTASPDSGLTVSASDSSCGPVATTYDVPRPRRPTFHTKSVISHKSNTSSQPDSEAGSECSFDGSSKSSIKGSRLVKCESMDIKEAMSRRPSGGRGKGFKDKLFGVRDKMLEKKGTWHLPTFSKKG